MKENHKLLVNLMLDLDRGNIICGLERYTKSAKETIGAINREVKDLEARSKRIEYGITVGLTLDLAHGKLHCSGKQYRRFV